MNFILRIIPVIKDKFFSNHRFFDENGGFWSVQENQSPSDYFDGQNDEDNHEKLKFSIRKKSIRIKITYKSQKTLIFSKGTITSKETF